MKTFYSIIAITLLTFTSLAQRSELTVFSDGGERFNMFINGRMQNEREVSYLTVRDLRADKIRVRVVASNEEWRIDKTVMLSSNRNNTFYIARNSYGEHVLKFQGTSPLEFTYEEVVYKGSNNDVDEIIIDERDHGHSNRIPNNNKNSQGNSGRYLPNGTMCSSPDVSSRQLMNIKFDIDARPMHLRKQYALDRLREHCWKTGQVVSIVRMFSSQNEQLIIAKQAYRNTYDTRNYEVVVRALRSAYCRKKLVQFLDAAGDEYVSHEEDVVVNKCGTVDYRDNSDIIVINGTRNVAMTAEDFSRARSAVRGMTFADSKMEVIKQLFQHNYMNVGQVMTMAKEFTFEGDKLEFAKLAYNNTVNQNEYYRVSSIFTFDSTTRELNKYISKQ